MSTTDPTATVVDKPTDISMQANEEMSPLIYSSDNYDSREMAEPATHPEIEQEQRDSEL